VERRKHRVRRSFLDIRKRVTFGGERGLLSIAFDPGYAHNRRFYLCYTNRAGDVEVDQFRRSKGSRVRAMPRSRRKVIVISHQQAEHHYGGQLEFYRGDLYIGIGDGGTAGDPENDAQNKKNLLGKILRIDPRASGGYRAPASNPFVGRLGRDEIFSLGLRNPWRFSFDRKTRELWIGDVGWNDWEEIDRAPVKRANGGNFGWHIFEGNEVCHACGSDGEAPPNYIPPVHVYAHTGFGNAIVGGYVVRDRRLSSLRGRYVYTDYDWHHLDALNPRTGNDRTLGGTIDRPTSMGEGIGGRLYVTTFKGPVYELVPGT
jgi:glucose/arabinose dehydrogenase